MKAYLLGGLAAVISAALMYFAWGYYRDFLYQGRKPPEGVTKLLSIEKDGMPKIQIQDLSGKQISFSEFEGKVVIVNFWASWCEPCVKEFPSLLKLIKEFKGKIILVAVSGDYEREDIGIFLKAFAVNDPHVIVTWDENQAIAKQFGTFQLPESYIFGPSGVFVRKIVGVDDWATPDAFDYFKSILVAKPKASQ